jgi:HrpA-like RNA helicase
VHERGLESDFALALLLDAAKRRAGSSTSRKTAALLKIILMSATVQTDKFAAYLRSHVFGPDAASALQGRDDTSLTAPAPILHIPGQTFPVQLFYRGQFERAIRGSLKCSGDEASATAADNEGSYRYGGYSRGAGSIDYDLMVRRRHLDMQLFICQHFVSDSIDSEAGVHSTG